MRVFNSPLMIIVKIDQTVTGKICFICKQDIIIKAMIIIVIQNTTQIPFLGS